MLLKSRLGCKLYFLYFILKETEAQRDQVICSRPHSKWQRRIPTHLLLDAQPCSAISRNLPGAHVFQVFSLSPCHYPGPGPPSPPAGLVAKAPRSSPSSLLCLPPGRVSFKYFIMKNVRCMKKNPYTHPRFNHDCSTLLNHGPVHPFVPLPTLQSVLVFDAF